MVRTGGRGSGLLFHTVAPMLLMNASPSNTKNKRMT